MAQGDNSKGLFPLYPDKAPIMRLPIATGQTLARGDAVILSSNQISIALYDSAILCGVVAQDCSGLTAGDMVPVWADPDTIFVIRQDDTTACAVGSEYDLTGATGLMQLDGDASSIDAFKIVKGPLANGDGSTPTAAAGRRWAVKINKHTFAQID